MKRLILVDGNSLMYRAYYGSGDPRNIKPNSKGIFTNAVSNFARMISHLLKSEYDGILVAFDAGKHTFRHDIQQDYKAGRAHMPDEMRMQIAYIKDYLRRCNICQYEIKDYEADDIIGTMSKKALDAGWHVDIYSSDKDLLQLIDDNSVVHLTKKGMTELEDFDEAHFFDTYQISSKQWIDLKALMGDTSDNISGVPGIGPKKGIKLLQEFNTCEGIIENIENIKGKDKEKFLEYKDLMLVCKKMVTILKDAPLQLDLNDTLKKEPDNDSLEELYEYLELTSLLKDLRKNIKKEVYDMSYKVVNDTNELKTILLPNSSLIFETYEYNYHKSPLLVIGLKNKLGNFIIYPDMIQKSEDLRLFLQDDNHKDIYDYKRAYVLLKKMGYKLQGIDFDMLLATYVLNPSITKNEFKTVASFYEYYDLMFDEEVYGKGAKRQIPDSKILENHVIKKVECLFLLKNKIKEELQKNNQMSLLTDIEIPLSVVLGDMEFNGLKIDKEELLRQKKDLKGRIDFILSEIYRIVGHEFNVSSPKQLGVVLFEELGLPCKKKTKTGYSTDQEVLESLKNINPVVEYILSYRQLTKLYQTYIIGLEEQMFEDGKVHTIYEQALTQTGRLSSIEPNLQNIPIRTEEGKNIRKMFVPEDKENQFFASDYSQIELRVLAHMANVEKLIESFNLKEDIHSKTAKDIFAKDEITSDDRRKAKAVNFGIIYGISAYGLAQDIHISNMEASNYIKRYYEVYPQIKEFMENTIEFAKEFGYVKTIKNRIRFIPDINSNNFQAREFAKRTAMNAPIQGSAADIIKMAMVNIYKKLNENKMESKMLIQIHDELVFEVKKGEEEALEKLVRQEMENVIKLRVPLVVSHDFGKTWYDVK